MTEKEKKKMIDAMNANICVDIEVQSTITGLLLHLIMDKLVLPVV